MRSIIALLKFTRIIRFNDYMSFGQKLKEIRLKFNLKQTDFANSLRVTPQAVSKWERDENFPDIPLLKKIASLFNISIDFLLGLYESENEIFKATIFCTGLQNYALKAASISPKELAEGMNVCFYHMTEILLKEGGIPVKYTGDGFLAFFSGLDHADRALKAALKIQKNVEIQQIAILLHSGQLYLGQIGHPDYASKDIYGDSVNQAFLVRDEFIKAHHTGIGCTGAFVKDVKKNQKFTLNTTLNIPFLKKRMAVYQPNQKT